MSFNLNGPQGFDADGTDTRAAWEKVRDICSEVVSSQQFTYVITFFIIIAAVLVGIDTNSEEGEYYVDEWRVESGEWRVVAHGGHTPRMFLTSVQTPPHASHTFHTFHTPVYLHAHTRHDT